ncbi:MAG TPA: hypothetical protein RMH99_23290 [Sandaracinaceae bacterium LLY-WYZ-13_1]|nr:hypothetical protein [Sandaracinaceae bacterium LLY-WYZ-13_1]
MGFHRAALVSTVLLLAGGCVPVVPVPVLPQPNAVHGEARSDLTPVERLGRWDGERFVPVRAGSVPPSHLYVIVHGWAPGWGRSVVDEPRLRSWQARDGEGQPFEPWVHALARVIEDHDPHAVVLSYSWLDDAGTSRFILAQRNAWAHTDEHGQLMAEGVRHAWREDFIAGAGRMHLIGHSYGARVAALAALYLPKRPQHLTTFDPPDATMTYMTGGQTRLADVLRKLPVGRGRGKVFVDNYVSMVGARYGGSAAVVDVTLSPPYSAFDYRRRHLYPMDFYARTADRDIGFGWSPLRASRPPAAGCWHQPYGEVALVAGCGGLP